MPVPREFLFGFLRLSLYRPVLYLFLSATRSSVFSLSHFFLFPVFVLFLVSLRQLSSLILKRLPLSGSLRSLSGSVRSRSGSVRSWSGSVRSLSASLQAPVEASRPSGSLRLLSGSICSLSGNISNLTQASATLAKRPQL